MARMTSLKKDISDDKAFRYSRARHLGVCVSSEFYQPCPMFFTREGANLNIIGLYRGSSLFIVANGPSLRDHDVSLLQKPGIMTYGMNNGPRTVRTNFWTCVDDPSRFIKSLWLDPRITKFVPQAMFEKKLFDNSEKWIMTDIKVGECPNVVGFRRNEKFVAERFLWEDTINWGNHKDYGGGRSVMLPVFRIAFLLGFRTIYLVGCDFKMSENYTYHFDEQRAKGAVNCNNSTYKRMNEEYFPQLKPYLDAEGVKVFNCNADSGLKVFPYKSFEEAISEATASLGNLEKERTYGLYIKPGPKEEIRIEPPASEKKNMAGLKPLQAPKEQVSPPIVAAANIVAVAEQLRVPKELLESSTPFVENVGDAPALPSLKQQVRSPNYVLADPPLKQVEVPVEKVKENSHQTTSHSLLKKPLE